MRKNKKAQVVTENLTFTKRIVKKIKAALKKFKLTARVQVSGNVVRVDNVSAITPEKK